MAPFAEEQLAMLNLEFSDISPKAASLLAAPYKGKPERRRTYLACIYLWFDRMQFGRLRQLISMP